MVHKTATLDGNEAASRVAYLTNEVVAIYPITPSSNMGENADAWAAAGKPNIFGTIPDVIEMQSEAGAAGACHGSLQAGALTTTFTASQGLLLMIPNMFKISGELSPAVFHISARTVATHALSIFGDHSDVMSCRTTGWAMLASGSIQEAQDMAMIAQMSTLKSRVPFLHFFDGFRTSHEVSRIDLLPEEDVKALIDMDLVRAHRDRCMSPDRPVLRGTAQNPDVFFQAREACNPFYDSTAGIVEESMQLFAERTGRKYNLFDYVGAPDAEKIVVLMGSGIGAAKEMVDHLVARGEKVGALFVRLYRPFAADQFISAIPETVKGIVALDRTKEPGSLGEPLYQDVLTAFIESGRPVPNVIGGRYGLSSKEFTPAMVKGALDELDAETPRRHVTVGIEDDVTRMSVAYDPGFNIEPKDVTQAVFYGLGADGTVGANKNTVKIIGENTPLYSQGYFVYDSKKAGAVTVSHVRISPREIHSTYLITKANFVAVHQFNFFEKMDMIAIAEKGATLLLNAPYPMDEVWDHIPTAAQKQIIEKKLKVYAIDAASVAVKAGMGQRINTVMQTCFFALSGVLPLEEAIAKIKGAIEKTYKKRGQSVLDRNYAAVDGALAAMHPITVPAAPTGKEVPIEPVPAHAPKFVREVLGPIIANQGDTLPVSAFPVDGTFPTGTTLWEKRSIAREIPIWDADICTQCGICSIVCPHAAIRIKSFDESKLEGAPESFVAVPYRGKDRPAGTMMSIQVAPDDCTGCEVCVEQCPARNKKVAKRKAINMEYKLDHLERERANWDFFTTLPEVDPKDVKVATVKGSQQLEPLFQFSGACSGCGETAYVKLLSQLFGDRMIIANATGCSSIYGGNLPTTPYTPNAAGRGPTWSNSLFEDCAEFALGMRLAVDAQRQYADDLLGKLQPSIEDDALCTALLESNRVDEEHHFEKQWGRVAQLKSRLEALGTDEAKSLLAVVDSFVDRSVWAFGGDGWAYDIGFGGLDHVLASGRNVNILVMDTEVYSNTGGQASKATPRGAIAKFATSGKPIGKKDLGMIAMSYGNVYVASVSMGANPRQVLKAFLEAEAYPGPSIVMCYATCIAHGINMATSLTHQKDGVKCGYWPLFRYTPTTDAESQPLTIDAKTPEGSFMEFGMKEARFAYLMKSQPERARKLFALAQKDIDERWRFYQQLAGVERSVPSVVAAGTEEVDA